MKSSFALAFACLGLLVAGSGCATTTHGVGYSDNEMAVAQRRAEEETLARLAASNNEEIADTAQTMAREQDGTPDAR